MRCDKPVYVCTPSFILPFVWHGLSGSQLSVMAINDYTGANCFARSNDGRICYGPIQAFRLNMTMSDVWPFDGLI